MNTSLYNIWWMPIMSGESLGFKIWSWPNNFLKTISNNMDEISIVNLEVSLMTW
jgi:hypothetical protein